MTRLFRLSAALVGLGLVACSASPDYPSETEARQMLEVAKVDTWRALYRENDADGLDAFLADDFVIIGKSGSVQTKDDILADMRASPWDMPEDFLYTVTGIRFPTDGSAIVYGHGDSTRVGEDGSTCHHHYTSSNVFRFDDGHWRPVSSHVSDAACT